MSFYRIGDLILEIDSKGIRLQKELDDFLLEEACHLADIRIEFNRTGTNLDFLQLPSFNGKRLFQNRYVNVYEDADNYFVTFFNSSIVYGYSCSKKRRESVVYCADVDFEIFDTYNVDIGADVPMIMNGPEMLVDAVRDSFLFHALFFGRLSIHSAAIVYKDRAWLFSAMSGVGKTTHIKMWEEIGASFEVLNGDLALIYEKGDIIVAAGMPWCGTSKSYLRNEVPLGGNISLRREEKDTIQLLTAVDGVFEMLGRCTSPTWDKYLMNKIVDILVEIVPKIKSAVLWCTPTVEAAKASRKFIEDIMDENS